MEGKETPPLGVILPFGAGLLDPEKSGVGSSASERGGALPGTSVSEIHAYPPRPEGFEEPLFATPGSRRVVMDHLLEAPWLSRASRLEKRSGGCAHSFREPVGIEGSPGRVMVVRTCGRRREKRRVSRVLSRGREGDRWWEEEGVDRLVFAVLLSGGAVVHLARERRGGWFLVGVED